MASFQRIDPGGDLNTGNSTFLIADSRGRLVELSQKEAGELMRWLQSFLTPPEAKEILPEEQEYYHVTTFRFLSGDIVEHHVAGRHQAARFLRIENSSGHRYVHLQAESGAQYRILAEEVEVVSRVIGERTSTYYFEADQDETP